MPKAPAGTLYRGREGMWSWVAHRVTGVLIFFFLFAHVLDTALVRVSADSYDRVIDTYKTPLVNVMELGLVGAVLFHALNGLRVMAIDFWDKGARFQRQMTWAIVAVFIVVGSARPVAVRAATSRCTRGSSCACPACCCWSSCSATCSS
jgi:succinate dehydrogenase / fumarate reductase cytochrome b subunit